MKLEGQVAIVTGAGKGLGAAFAKALAAEGASIVCSGRKLEPLQALATELGHNHMAITCDVTDEVQIQTLVAKTIERYGKLDILVNNAGVAVETRIPFDQMSTEAYDQLMDTNLRGAFLCSRYAWPHLKASQGQILNVSSISGSKPFEGFAAYCASKFGLNGLSEVLSLEGRPFGIRVLNVCPGSVDTDIWVDMDVQEPRKKMMKPDQVAELARWMLTSPRNIEVRQAIIENFQSPFE